MSCRDGGDVLMGLLVILRFGGKIMTDKLLEHVDEVVHFFVAGGDG